MGEFVPYIPPEKHLPDLTLKAIILGVLLSAVMAAANAYLGLYVGMTVSAAIPAAVVSIAILGKIFKGNILENNAVMTMAASGEALAAGVIFTIPALLIIYQETNTASGWADLSSNLWLILITALIGGVMGVLFTIPLRRILIRDLDLPYPEGVACSEVLKVGERSGGGVAYMFMAFASGILFKLAGSEFGLNLWLSRIEAVWQGAKAKLYGGTDLSPALLGVGYIIGPRVSAMVLGGGVFGWMILIPIIGYMTGFYGASGLDAIFTVWANDTKYVGIGAIVVGGVYTLYSMRQAIMKGVREALVKKKETGPQIRTERDFPMRMWFFAVIFLCMLLLYYYVTRNIWTALVAAVIMLLAAFFFTAVAGYIAGVLGSSNNPISGVTVATLLFTSVLLFVLMKAGIGAEENLAMTATIIVAGVICCSAAIAGDCMQNMKAGQLLGSTPRTLQIAEFIGVGVTALIIGPVLVAIHQAYEIGVGVKAPQAFVMAGVVVGVFSGDMNWPMVAFGAAIAVFLIILEKAKIAKVSIMAVAIGIYLPLTLSVPIMMGGLIKLATDRYLERSYTRTNAHLTKEDLTSGLAKLKEKAESRGILVSSGLIAGEALTGVIIAGIVVGLEAAGKEKTYLNVVAGPQWWPGLLVFAFMGLALAYLTVRSWLNFRSAE